VWSTLSFSRETHEQVERLCELLATEDPLGATPSKHRAVAIAVVEAIARREQTT